MNQPRTRDPTERRVVFSRQPLLIVGYAIGVAMLPHTAAFMRHSQPCPANLDAQWFTEVLPEPDNGVSTGLAEENG